MLKDDYGREFHYLRLSLTELCNFKCNYCLPDGNDCDSEDRMSLEEIKTLVSAFASLGTSKVRLTGGEPALRKDLIDIIQAVKSVEGIKEVALTTNGYKLERDAHRYAQAGLDRLNISIDSFDPDTFKLITGADKLKSIMQGIENAQANGLHQIKINSVLLREFNISQFERGIDFIRDKNIDLRFIELMQTGSNTAFYEANHVSGESLKERLLTTGWSLAPRKLTDGPAQTFVHPESLGRIGLIMPYSKDFCQTCNRLRVSSEGKLHLCLFAEQGLSIREPIRDGDIKATAELLKKLIVQKSETHYLDAGITGATRHLAMLGG